LRSTCSLDEKPVQCIAVTGQIRLSFWMRELLEPESGRDAHASSEKGKVTYHFNDLLPYNLFNHTRGFGGSFGGLTRDVHHLKDMLVTALKGRIRSETAMMTWNGANQE